MVCWDLRLCLSWGESCLDNGFGRGRGAGVSVSRALRRWDERRRPAIVAN